jgi:hypothetical protein
LSLLPVAAVACSAAVASADENPVPRTEKTYFHCGTQPKVGNIDTPASWNTTAPTQSVTAGAGCGQADNSQRNTTGNVVNVAGLRVAGTFTGVLRDLTVRVDNIYAGAARSGTPETVLVSLTVDGVKLLDGKAVTVPGVQSSTKLSDSLTFSVTDLGLTSRADDVAHQVSLNVKSQSEPLDVFVYDTTEVPAGIEFNPTTLATAHVAR